MTQQETRSVLVVDDDRHVRRLLERIFERMELRPRIEADPNSGLRALEEGPYELIVTDLRMPGVDGLEIVKQAKRRWADSPVVVITGYATEEDEATISSLGARLLTKPFRAREAIEIFRDLLGFRS